MNINKILIFYTTTYNGKFDQLIILLNKLCWKQKEGCVLESGEVLRRKNRKAAVVERKLTCKKSVE